jgi:hypothetical protein
LLLFHLRFNLSSTTLSPGGCGAAPPPPPPAKPSVSLSGETGERNADEACCYSSSAVTTRGGVRTWARTVRNASRGLGSTLWPERASAARLGRHRRGSRRGFVVRRKERAARSAGQPAFSIARTVRSPAGWLSFGQRSRVEWASARTGPVEPAGGFWTARVRGKVYPARPSESEMRLHAKEIYVRQRDERRICFVELIDANRKKTLMVTDWQLVGRTLIGETYHCIFIAAVCTLRPASVPTIPTRFDTVTLAAVTTISATLSKLWWL